jgi:hypothetical protein
MLGQCLKIVQDHPLAGAFQSISINHHLLQKAMLNKQTCSHYRHDRVLSTELNYSSDMLLHLLYAEVLNRCSHVMRRFRERDLEIESIRVH